MSILPFFFLFTFELMCDASFSLYFFDLFYFLRNKTTAAFDCSRRTLPGCPTTSLLQVTFVGGS